jgi:prepilin-type processing-associated H-X9-DG protein
VQAAREAARRVQCTNHAKQLGLAVHNYLSAHRVFPSASRTHWTGGNVYYRWIWGPSWGMVCLPFLEEQALYDRVDMTGAQAGPKYGPQVALVYQDSAGGNVFNSYNGRLLAGVKIPVLTCPSSTVDPMTLTDKYIPGPAGIVRPMYTAITGAVDHRSAVNKDNAPDPHRAVGIQSRGGVLQPYVFTKVRAVSDGLSKCILLGEQSDFCTNAAGQQFICMSDFEHGFQMGAVPEINYVREDRWFNSTTVRYGIGHKDWNSPGVGVAYYGVNRPIQSAHPGGAHVTMGDGSVQFLAEDTNLQLLFNLCNRDDGNVTGGL